MAHRIVCDISDDLRQLLSMGRSGPFVDDWKRTNAYAVRYQDENVILAAQVKRLESDRAELIAVLREVIRISDRKHEAWDAAKAALAKATGEPCT